jgi:hypothetical protein
MSPISHSRECTCAICTHDVLNILRREVRTPTHNPRERQKGYDRRKPERRVKDRRAIITEATKRAAQSATERALDPVTHYNLGSKKS